MAEKAKELNELTPEELRALLAKKDAELAAVKKDANETIEELKVQLKVGGTADKPVTTVKHKGKVYRFTNERFTLPEDNTGVEIESKDATAEQVEKLIKQGSGLLVEVK